MSPEERLDEFEIKLARQDDVVDTLNRMVYEHQKKIDELEVLCSGLAKRLKEMQEAASDVVPIDERPPHY